jgi:chemotaxis methyl-accepting protein methylase
MEPLMAWLLDRAGLSATGYRPAAMKRRLTSCLRQLRVASARAAREELERRPELLAPVLNTVLIGVTDFFRDAAVFEYLAGRVLPELRRERGQLRICSVGVSGGQELYSVAMLLHEAGMLERSWLLGADCRADAVGRAEAGVFSEAEMAGVSPSRRAAFFRSGAAGWEAAPVLKERIQWRTADVMGLEIEARQALVLFRNVAIYFTEAQTAAAWARLCGRLVPGGFIVTGKAEKPPSGLPLKRVAPSIYRRIPF